MNSYQVSEKIKVLASSVTSSVNLIKLIRELSSHEEKLEGFIREGMLYSGDNNRQAKAHNGYMAQIESARKVLDTAEIGEIFLEIANLKNLLEALKNTVDNSQENLIENLLFQLNIYRNKYETVIKNRFSNESLIDLLKISGKIDIDFSNLIRWSNFLSLELQNQPDFDTSNLLEFSIFLNSEYLYKEIVLKLQAIQNIYSEICQILGISEIDFPLRVVKVESGSLWVKVFGEPTAINFLIDVCKNTIAYFHRNFTKEGKIASIPRKTEAIENLLGFTQKLQDHGIDTTPMKENIRKSSLLITEEACKLLIGEAKVNLNNENFNISAEFKQRYISESKKYLLTGSNDNSTQTLKLDNPLEGNQ
jgi:hypothetical protein